MKDTPEFKKFLDAIEDILNGKAVDDLDGRIKACKFDVTRDPPQLLNDLKGMVLCSLNENEILNGKDPAHVYETHDYVPWQKDAHKTLRDALKKYR